MHKRHPDLPSLHALWFFEVASRHGSFTKAAQEELFVTQGAVSRQISLLEEELGTALFERDGRGISLTQAGSEYAREIRAALDQIDASTARLKTHRDQALSISVYPSTAQLWLLPRLMRFEGSHPCADIRVVSANRTVDLVREGVHMAIRHEATPAAGLECEALYREEMLVVCTKEYLDRAAQQGSVLHTPRDLAAHRLLHNTARIEDVWARYFEARLASPPPRSHFRGFRHFFLVLEAVRQHMGVGLVPTILAERALSAGQLIVPFERPYARLDPDEKAVSDYYLVYRKEARSHPAFEAFRAFLHAEIRLDSV